MIVAGIDVSKNELFAHAEGEDRRFATMAPASAAFGSGFAPETWKGL